MSFREKSAWISFVLILLASCIQFTQAARVMMTHSGYGRLLQLHFALLGGLVVLEVVVHIAIAIQSPRDARTPKDERERLIDMKATRLAFPVLLVGAFSANLPRHMGGGPWEMSQIILLAIVAAELVKFGAQIVYHRRGF
jgi:hypothetical protein